MAKKVTGTQATAWKRFSEMIRVAGCLRTTGLPFVGVCATCSRRQHISYLDCGHCIAGRGNAILFHEERVDIQCRRCNQILNGRLKKFQLVLARRHNPEVDDTDLAAIIDQWKADAKKPVSVREFDFKAMATEYRERTNALLKESNSGYYTYEDILAGKSF